MINVRMQQKDVTELTPKITVIGVGGAGGNAVNNMISSGLQGVDFVVCNTDAQALRGSQCESKLQLGVGVTGGLGAGAKPDVGREAAEESLEDVMAYLDGANMAFITAGMGGGTGTGAAPVIARACREKGILTVGVVTKPFHFEGTLRMKMADAGIEEMQQYVDTLIVIPNQNLFRIANEKTTFAEAFKMADSVLQSGVRGVTDLMVMPGQINLDFNDIKSAMLEMGKAMMGTGEADGEKRAVQAAEAAINNPLLDDVSMQGARGVIINVTGGYDMTLYEIDEACNRIREEVDPNANIIFGSTLDEKLEGTMRVSVVATGIDGAEREEGGSERVVNFTRTPAKQAQPNSAGGSEQQGERRLPRAQPRVPGVSATQGQSAAVQQGSGQESESASAQNQDASSSSPAPSYSYRNTGMSLPLNLQSAATAARPQEKAQDGDQSGKVETQGSGDESGSLRGTIHNNKFIPPRPVMPSRATEESHAAPVASQKPAVPEQPEQAEEQKQETLVSAQNLQTSATPSTPPIAPSRDSGYGPSFSGLSARRPADTSAQQATPSLNLRPPVPGGQREKEEPKKSASFFDRFANSLKAHGEALREQARDVVGSSSAPSRGTTETSAKTPAPSRRPLTGGGAEATAQGQLNIDAGPDLEHDDELDIPAFLRRQAN